MTEATRAQELEQLTRLFQQSCTEHLAPFGYVRTAQETPASPQRGCVVAFDNAHLSGSLSVCAPKAFLERTHPLKNRNLDARDLDDWMGEQCNRLLGRFKSLCLGRGLDFSVGVPRVVDGERLRPAPASTTQLVSCRLASGNDVVDAWLELHRRGEAPLFGAATEIARGSAAVLLNSPRATGSTAKKILIVDDSRTVRQEVKAVLAEAGFEVLEAVDGRNGLDLIARHPDLAMVVCDINMPRLNGLQLLEELKQVGRSATLPVLMLTTEGAATLIAKAKQLGAVAWMLKPFKRDQLVASVRKITGAGA